MDQSKYYITKTSGTYAETLEAYGLAKVLSHILRENGADDPNIRIRDEGGYYSITASVPITEKMVNKTPYFDAYPYIKIKNDDTKDIPSRFIDFENEQNKMKVYKKKNEVFSKAKGKKGKEKPVEKLDNLNKPHPDYDILNEVKNKNIRALHNKILLNVFLNKEDFVCILKTALLLYSQPLNKKELAKSFFKENCKHIKMMNVSALQIFNPHQGKGVNSEKANSIRLHNVNSFWIREYLKIIGVYESMVIKSVKVSSTKWDTKFYVIDPLDINFDMLHKIYIRFKPLLNDSKPLKLDILSLLYYTENLISLLPDYQQKKRSFLKRFKPCNSVQGFKTAYQKKLSTYGGAIINIGYLRLPEFIEISSYEEGQKWIEILKEHIDVIRKINEDNRSTILPLRHYRQFLSTGNWDEFFEFYFDYATLLMKDVKTKKMNLKAFTVKNIKEVLMTEKKFGKILESSGFQNIAKAIRNATINEQYAKANGNQRFSIRYGMAQDLKRKSPYKEDLVECLSEFIASYNSETARYVEHHIEEFREGKVRATIKTEDIKEIIDLIDEYGSSVVGKLLAAYGYALERKEENFKSNVEK